MLWFGYQPESERDLEQCSLLYGAPEALMGYRRHVRDSIVDRYLSPLILLYLIYMYKFTRTCANFVTFHYTPTFQNDPYRRKHAWSILKIATHARTVCTRPSRRPGNEAIDNIYSVTYSIY